jgi:3D (Asp-Asp-Asp) domain-containing protein
LGNTTNRPVRPLFALPLSALFLTLSSLPVAAADNVRVLADGKALSSSGDTVRDALAEAGITLDKDDEVSPALDQSLSDGATIRVQRVSYKEGATEEKIPYRTIVRPASGPRKPYHPTITKPGRSGLKRLTYRVKLVDGREIERTTIGEEVVREPDHEIVTSRKPYLLGSRGAYIGRRTLTMVATAYDPGPGSCGKWANGRTCNGKRAGYGIIAVDPKVIPLGTKLFVPGYGYGIAADVGGAIKGNRVDLGFNSRSGSFKWGRRVVQLQIVE